MLHTFLSQLYLLKKRVTLPLVLLGLCMFFFMLNSTYVSYPDEFVNLLGGRAILMGKLPYRDYFDHHMPLAWYLSALIQIVSQGDYVTFRIIWGAIQGGLIVLLGLWVYRSHRSYSLVYGLWSVLYATSAVYYWLHLYLGDAIAALFFSIAFWILLLETSRRSHTSKPLAWASLSVAALIFSSLSYLYLGAFLYAWILLIISNKNPIPNTRLPQFIPIPPVMLSGSETSPALLGVGSFTPVQDDRIEGISSTVMFWIGWFLAPYTVYGLYLVLTGTLRDFWFANFTYNTTLYISISNYTANTGRFNPLRFAFTIADNFWGAYLTLLSRLAHPSFYEPMDRTVAIGTLLLVMYLLWKRWPYGVLFLGMLTFSAPRSGQLSDMKQTDYQMGIFIILGSIAAAYMTRVILHDLDLKGFFVKFTRSVCLLFLVLYFSFTLVFSVFHSLHIRYLRYMEKLPPISNLSDLADFAMNIVPEGEAYWIGPYEGNTSFFVRGRTLVGKYPSLLPQFQESPSLRQDFLAQMEKAHPIVIIYKHDASIFMTPSIEFGAFFLDWMSSRYVNCVEAHVECRGQVSDLKMHEDIYVRKDRLDLLKKI